MQTDDTEMLLELFNRTDHGPSAWGLSTHTEWTKCGKRAEFKANERAARLAVLADGAAPDNHVDQDKLSYLYVGLHFHKLMEARILRQLGNDLIWDARASAFDINFLEAIRLYRGYHANWGSLEERWGCRVLAAELGLGEGPTEDKVVAALGGKLTGRADAVIEIVDPERAKHFTGHDIMPGRYIFDYKTSKAHGSGDAEKFGPRNLQAQAYLWLDTVEHGAEGAVGCIFERVIGHKELIASKSYASFVVYPQMDASDRLRALVELSNASQANPRHNPLMCDNVDGYGRPCWFGVSGQCRGY